MVNLGVVADARQLETALEAFSTNPADRSFAARELFRFVAALRLAGGRLPNVDAILGATVPVAAIEGTPRLGVYVERLRAARENAAHAGRAPPATLRLLTSGDLAAIKPAFIVRTPEAFARELFIWGTVYVARFLRHRPALACAGPARRSAAPFSGPPLDGAWFCGAADRRRSVAGHAVLRSGTPLVCSSGWVRWARCRSSISAKPRF